MDIIAVSDSDIVSVERDVAFEGDKIKNDQKRGTRSFRTRTYVLYCLVTLSVVLLSLALAATELFSAFFAYYLFLLQKM